MKTPSTVRRQLGMSLIELMITLLLSTLLLLGLMQLYLNSNSTDRANSALARLQENGRIALELLKQDMRRTGYQGCAMPSAQSRENSTMTFPLDAFGPVSADATPEEDEIAEGAGTGNDQLVMRYARPIMMRARVIGSSSMTIVTTDAISMTAGERYNFLLTNCHEVAIFSGVASARTANTDTATQATMPAQYTITALQGLNGGAAPSLNGFPSGEGSQFLAIAENSYWVAADPTNKDNAGNGIPTLYKNGDPMIAGVDNFQVLYGVENGGTTRWVNADDLDDDARRQVSRLQVSLVMSSDAEVADKNNTQNLPIANIGNDTELPAIADRRLRRVFNAVIDVRNRQ